MGKLKVAGLKRETKRLVLRPLQMRDDRAWFAAHCAMLPTKSSWEFSKLPLSQLNYPEYAKILAEQKQQIEADSKYSLGVFHKETGTLLGFVFIEDIVREKKSRATLDFRIFNPYWGKGFAKEAVNEGMKLKKNLQIDQLEVAAKSASRVKL